MAVPVAVESSGGGGSGSGSGSGGGSGGLIDAVELVQRTPRAGVSLSGFDVPYSQQLRDWYSSEGSSRFAKARLRLVPRGAKMVVVDATELGDGLVLAGAPLLQGTERDERRPADTVQGCGQAIAFAAYVQQGTTTEGPPPPRERAAVAPSSRYSLDNHTWSSVWSYRRVAATAEPQVSLQAWGGVAGDGNDYPFGYHLLPPPPEAPPRSGWNGGVNLTTLAAAEAYALGWLGWYANHTPASMRPPTVVAGARGSGTASGLAKLPYVRDTRRSVGLGGFVLRSADLSAATRFADRVGIGDYLYYDVHGVQGCAPPKFPSSPLQPYYLPLRALTTSAASATNLLVAGKTMAQTQAANAATRLHPVEWASGTAAGVLAVAALDATVPELIEACTASDDELCDVQRRVARLAPIDWASA